jgi:hypothetical protein
MSGAGEPGKTGRPCEVPEKTTWSCSTMVSNNSPLESLAAFAITFAVGVLSTVALGKYIEKVRRDAINEATRAS